MKYKNHVLLTLVMLLAVGLMTACLNSSSNVSDNDYEDAEIEEQVEPVFEEEVEQPVEEMEPTPTITADAIDQQAGESMEADSSGNSATASLIFCDTGAAAPPNDWYDNFTFEIVANDQTINFSTTLPDRPVDQLFFAGVDFRSINRNATAEIPGFALGEGTTFGVSAGFQGDSIAGILASRAGEQGEILPWTTAATAEISEGVFTIEIPLNEIGNDTDKFRFTFSDGVVCQLSGILEQDLGFSNFENFAPEVGEQILNNVNQEICFPDICFSVPVNAGWELTGDHTGNVTIADLKYALQSYVSSNNSVEILDTFENIGWNAVPDGTLVSAIGDFQQYDMLSNNLSYGSLGLNVFNDSENPRMMVVSIIGQTPISAANRETFIDFFYQVQDSVRPGL